MATLALTQDDADRELDRLTTDGERIAEALAALESHAGYIFLNSATLTDESATAWAGAKSDIASLYQRYDYYRGVLDKAREVRSRRHRPGPAELTELTTLLRGSAIELSTEEIPLDRRNLRGPATVTHRMTLTELVTSMDTLFQRASDVVVSADEVWSTAVATLDPMDERIGRARELAASLGLGEARHPLFVELNDIGDELAALRARAFSDPFTLYVGKPGAGRNNVGSVAGPLTTRLTDVLRQLDAMATVRAEVDQRVGMATNSIDALGARFAQARDAYALVLDKIATPAIAEPFDETALLRRQLDEVRVLVNKHDWPGVEGALRSLRTATDQAAARLRDVQDTADALLGRRAELRGRLDAYRVKAAQLRVTEDPEITASYQAAYDLLWTVPCDLRAATRALHRYQQAISARGRTP